MGTGVFWELGSVSDDGLRSQLTCLLASGYRTEARIIAHLAEVDERKLYLKDGSESLFAYCTLRLALSSSEAFHRTTAARIARRYPIVFSLIEQRQLHLTAVCLLRDYLTHQNHRELLAEASGKTKLQVQELIARRFPRPGVSSGVRKLPDRPARAPAEANPGPPLRASAVFPNAPIAPSAPALMAPQAPPPPAPSARPLIEPLSEARYRIQLNASAALKDKLEHLANLLSHSIPNRDLAEVIERALDLAIARAENRRFGKTKHPRSPRALKTGQRSAGSARDAARKREHLAHDLRRTINDRDKMQCAYRAPDGCRCTARAFLQFHHKLPWARNGATDEDNVTIFCQAHNLLRAEQDFGSEFIARRRAK